jgi:hypothetical protein
MTWLIQTVNLKHWLDWKVGSVDNYHSTWYCLSMAGGPILEVMVLSSICHRKNVNLDGMNPTMLKQFLNMVEEYGVTGKTVHPGICFPFL